ncbi:MAG TPA: antibiotic biosynthesis monooxygenase [Bacillales bacterium]|nr:antibiotic biosynthesis monooxygenase [Bacillales bacterium]
MFVAVNTITTEDTEKMAEMFRKAAPQLKKFDGFLGFELWRDGNKIESISRWASKEAFDAYINSDMFHQHHSGEAAKQESHSQASYYEGEVIV